MMSNEHAPPLPLMRRLPLAALAPLAATAFPHTANATPPDGEGAAGAAADLASAASESAGDAWAQVVEVWRYQVLTVDERPVTVGKLAIAALLLILGLVVARIVARWVGKRLLPRIGMAEGSAAALQSMLFYLMTILAVVIALRAVSVPLTIFTILGGAAAIGIGFGSQNVLNNFISGLILLVERPVRVGDLIQLDDLYGNVEHIGLRSTRIRTGEHVDLIVPNSTFLESNVINWTLSGVRTRVHVEVGVAYGTDTDAITRILMQAASEHDRVFPEPEPIVLFTCFGDNALTFQIHFWTDVKRVMHRRIIESELRYRINTLCEENGVVIAFPQRDLHVDTLSPIEVKMVQA